MFDQTPRLHVVVVEDHDGLRDVVAEVLGSHGHSVLALSCAEEMEEKSGAAPIDLLIVDLNLPGEDGLSLARRFRLAQPTAGIIMLTARETVQDRVNGYVSGADMYLQKPVSMAELVAAVNSIARRLSAQASAHRLAQAASVFVDVENMLLRGPLGVGNFSSAEGLLLCALAGAPGRRLKTSVLLEHLRMDPNTYSKSAFEVRVVRLRRKLMDVGADKLCIRSTRMQGYQLSAALTFC